MTPDPRPASIPQQRREALLTDLMVDFRRHHRRRRIRRTLASASVPALIAFTATIWLSSPKQALNTSTQQSVSETVQNGQPSSTNIVFVQTDPGILSRYESISASRVIMLDDQALLQALAQINRPAGIIRSGEQVRLSADVTDSRASDGAGG